MLPGSAIVPVHAAPLFPDPATPTHTNPLPAPTRVDAKMFSMREKKAIVDASGRPVAGLKKKLVALKPTLQLFRGGDFEHPVATIRWVLPAAHADMRPLAVQIIAVAVGGGGCLRACCQGCPESWRLLAAPRPAGARQGSACRDADQSA